MRPAAFAACLAAVTLAACGGADDDDDSPDAQLGDPTVFVGRFNVELVAPVAANGTTPATDGYTSVIGTVYDKTPPLAVIWDQAAADGACTLRTPRVPFCSTPCGSSAVCVADDVCEPYAIKQTVGSVHARGLLATGGAAAEFDMMPIANNYQPPAEVHLAYPGFAPGADIRLEATGSAFTGAFTLAGTGIAPLALTSADPALARDQALALTWSEPSNDAAAQVEVELDISHHGGSKGKIVCAGPDTGALTLTASLMTQLLDLGAAGYPTIIVTRTATTSAVISAGRVDLQISSQVQRPVTVPGIQSCTDPSECPLGQTCRDDLTCG